MIRRLAERLSRGRVLARRLPERFGGARLFVSPDAALAFWRRDLETLGADLFDVAERFVTPGAVVWDVGANVGLFAFSAAQRAGARGSVLALEPDPFTAGLLRRSAAEPVTGRAPVEVLEAAASHAEGKAVLQLAARGRAANHLSSSIGSSQAGGTRGGIEVPTVTLDGLLRGREAPDVLKIDVEGAELDVLAGAASLLATARPILYCEVSERNADGATELLGDAGYALFDWEGEVPVERAAFWTLALPRELPDAATTRSQ